MLIWKLYLAWWAIPQTQTMSAKNKFISLKTKTILLLLCIFVFMLLGTIGILRLVMLDRFLRIEKTLITDHMTRTQNTIDEKIKSLEKLAFDWAVWDETYFFIDNQNQTYKDANLVPEVYLNLEIDAMILINDHGEIIYAQTIHDDNSTLSPISQSLNNFITTSDIIDNTDPDFKVLGIISLPEGPMMIVSSPILRSNGEGPIRGNLIIAFTIDEAYIASVRDQLKLDLSLITVDQSRLTPAQKAETGMKINVQDSNRISISAYKPDLLGVPVIKITITTDRDTYNGGLEGIYLVGGFIAFLSGLCIIILSFFMNSHFLSKLKYITSTVDEIGKDKTFSKRLIQQRSRDEFSVVVEEINGMLDDLDAAQKDNEFKANHDALTGLPNRRLLSEQMTHSLHLSERRKKMMAVLFLDLDNFKQINDTKGHDYGDEILKFMAERISQNIRKSDMLARIGGDEFIIVLEDVDNIEGVKVTANKVLRCFNDVVSIKDNDFFLSTSIGIAMYPEDGKDAETLIKHADLALYQAKEVGKSQYMFCTSAMKTFVHESADLSTLLHKSLDKNEFELVYQPQIDSSRGKIIGVEALLRWTNTELGTISPSKFIPIAEQTGLIIPIGEWVLRQACRQNVLWQQAGYPKFKVAVNISIRQFQNHDLLDVVKRVLNETGLSPHYLELEITESTAMQERVYIQSVLHDFKALGIQLAIDDFGTEYSSLNHLKNLPFDRLKIAMPFINGIGTNPKDEALTISIITLAKSLNMQVIAEGVETKSQLTFLRRNGCTDIQGYYYHKPMSVKAMEELLKKDHD